MPRIPTPIALMAGSLAVSLLVVALDAAGLAPGLRAAQGALLSAIDFPALLLQGMLALLLFAGTLGIETRVLHEQRVPVAVLAFGATALSTGVIGVAVAVLLRVAGIPISPVDALLFGALISPTDPIAVMSMLKSARAPAALAALVAGESLFNDGVGVVLFTLLLEVRARGDAPALGHAVRVLLQEAGGGLLFGWVLGHALVAGLRVARRGRLDVLVSLAAVAGGYALANAMHTSGPLAMVAAGLVVAARGRVQPPLAHFWEAVDEWLNAALFVLVGMEVGVVRFGMSGWQAVAAGAGGIAIVLGARALTVGIPIAVWGRRFGLPAGATSALVWGGLRGGLSVAMALSLPLGDGRETIVAMTYCVVAFSILVQGLTFGRAMRRGPG